MKPVSTALGICVWEFQLPLIRFIWYIWKVESVRPHFVLIRKLWMRIIFKNVSFAGRTWDFANFYLTESGQFYELRVNQSLNDGVIYEDEIRDAQKTYDYYKEKLNEKYGEKEEKDSEDGKYIIYLGSNDMGVMLSNERSRSKGGDYRRYVTLDYIQTEINRKQSAKSEDDL